MKMYSKKFLKILNKFKKIFIFSLLFMILFTSNSFAKENIIYLDDNKIIKLDDIIKKSLPNYEIKKTRTNELFVLYENDYVVEGYESMISDKISNFSYPLFKSTVVIAVDRNRIKDNIENLGDLTKIDKNIGVLDNDLVHNSVANILGNGKVNNLKLISFYKKLANKNNLTFLNSKKIDENSIPEILLIDDISAISLNKIGFDFELIVPENTLYLNKYLISKNSIELNSEKLNSDLLENGFRLVNGNFDKSLYGNISYEKSVDGMNYKDDIFYKGISTTLVRRFIKNEGWVSPASYLEEIISQLALLCISVYWGISSLNKILDRKIRKDIFSISILLMFWQLTKILKFTTPYSNIRIYTISWYLSYISIIFISMLSIWIALSVEDSLSVKPLRVIKLISGVLCTFVVITVLLNNYHGFYFNITSINNDISYKYGFLMPFPLAIEFCGIVLTTLILAYKSWKMPNKRIVLLPITLMIIFASFTSLFLMGLQKAISVSFTFSCSVLILTVYNLEMKFGVIPINSEYEKLFSNSSLNLELYDNEKNLIYSSDFTEVPKHYERKEIAINGGFLVKYIDYSDLHKLNAQDENLIRELEKNYEIIRKKFIMKQKLIEIETKKSISDKIENLLINELNNINLRIDNIKKNAVEDIDN